MQTKFGGYRGKGRELLGKFNVSVGDQLLIKTEDRSFEGILMPRYEFADEEHIVLKLRNGYNVGIDVSRVRSIKVLERGQPASVKRPVPKEHKPLPKVKLLGTGGTIASRVDYRTGGVSPAMSAEDLYSLVPELESLVSLSVENLFNVYSENMTPEHWGKIALEVYKSLNSGYEGVVIAHGTDTMHYTAAALSFALENLPKPVILVGAQRSSDRPSSDATTNLIAAVKASTSGLPGVFISMHDGLDDDRIAIHRGVRVRKNHTSRRDAFKSIDERPFAMIEKDELIIYGDVKRAEGGFSLKPRFSDKAYLLKFFPNQDPEIIDHLVDKGIKALIIEGTGLGHVSSSMIPHLRRAVEEGVFVGMTSQCIWGNVRMTVYETGRELLRAGVTPLDDMLSEVALVKAMWLLGQGYEGKELVEQMKKNLRGEYVERRSVK